MSHGSNRFKVSDAEMMTTSAMIVIAGTETTSTAMTGILFWLVSTPTALENLKEEIRSNYTSPDDIKLSAKLNNMPYLTACITE